MIYTNWVLTDWNPTSLCAIGIVAKYSFYKYQPNLWIICHF